MMAWSGSLACFGLDRISELRPTAGLQPTCRLRRSHLLRARFRYHAPRQWASASGNRAALRPYAGALCARLPTTRLVAGTAANDIEIRLALTVFDTHDLRMKLLSYGPEVEVLATAALRDWLREQHVAAGALPSKLFVESD